MTDQSEMALQSAPALAVLKKENEHFSLNGQVYFELPPGSHRPEQILCSALVADVIPTAPIVVGRVAGESTPFRFFSKEIDVTDPQVPARSRARVQAEFVVLREVFRLKDRSFETPPSTSMRYIRDRKPGIQGHNMDWITDTDGRIRASHYDFEEFYEFLKVADARAVLTEAGEKRLAQKFLSEMPNYEGEFGSRDYLLHMGDILTALRASLTFGKVERSIKSIVSTTEKPDPATLHQALHKTIEIYLDAVNAALSGRAL